MKKVFSTPQSEADAVRQRILKSSRLKKKTTHFKNIYVNLKKFVAKPKVTLTQSFFALLAGLVLGALICIIAVKIFEPAKGVNPVVDTVIDTVNDKSVDGTGPVRLGKAAIQLKLSTTLADPRRRK